MATKWISRHRHSLLTVASASLLVLFVAASGAAPERPAAVSARQNATGPGSYALPLSGRELTPVTWCGSGVTPDNRLPQSDPLSSSTIRVLYAFPADVPDRFETVADEIASDVAAIDAWWRTQDATRAPRWDLYAFPGCASGFASLDLGALLLARERAYYAAAGGFQRILREVTPHFGATEKALVFFDGYVIDPSICGVSDMAPRNGSPYGISVVSLRSDCWVDLGAGAGTARIAVHELGHNLGAVPSKAPNRCGDSGLGGHTCDSPNDLMFPYASPNMQLTGAILDLGHDDYYGHSAEWWDVQDSSWLMHLPLRTLQVAILGSGSVSSTPVVVACPGGCAATLESDFVVTLVGHPEPGAEFYGWKGACTGESTCRLKMAGDLTVQATFGPPRPTLAVRVKGKGLVTSTPAGIASPGHASAKFPAGTRVILKARPAVGWRLARWSSALGSRSTCALVLTADRSVTATFVRVGKEVLR